MSTLLRPIYSTRRANTPITLGRSHIEISWNKQQVQCDGEAKLYFQPQIQLIVTADLSRHPAAALQLGLASDPITLRYGSQSAAVGAIVSRSSSLCSASGTTQAKADLLPNPQRLTICPNRRKRLRSVTFHVVNFPSFHCTGTESTDLDYRHRSGKLQRLGRIVLSNGDWDIEVQTLPQTEALTKELGEKGGYAITHVGRLTRRDGRSFAISKAERALEELRLFVSFARGLWTPVILPVGFDANGCRIFEEWGVPIDTPWQSCFSWFDRRNAQTLAKLYPGFTALLRDPDLGESAKAALYWYLMSNRAGMGTGIDSGIILSQAALERLATAYFAKAGILSTSRNARSAAGRLRCACQDLQIPTAIPSAASSVYGARRRGAWKDLPEAITKVRNELVHPKARLKVPVGKVVSSVWNLAQWCIELFILRHSNYADVYSNRIRARRIGQVEKVPWVR